MESWMDRATAEDIHCKLKIPGSIYRQSRNISCMKPWKFMSINNTKFDGPMVCLSTRLFPKS